MNPQTTGAYFGASYATLLLHSRTPRRAGRGDFGAIGAQMGRGLSKPNGQFGGRRGGGRCGRPLSAPTQPPARQHGVYSHNGDALVGVLLGSMESRGGTRVRRTSPARLPTLSVPPYRPSPLSLLYSWLYSRVAICRVGAPQGICWPAPDTEARPALAQVRPEAAPHGAPRFRFGAS